MHFAFSDIGIILTVLTFVFRLDEIVRRLIAVILLIAGLLLFFRWGALKGKEGQNVRSGRREQPAGLEPIQPTEQQKRLHHGKM